MTNVVLQSPRNQSTSATTSAMAETHAQPHARTHAPLTTHLRWLAGYIVPEQDASVGKRALKWFRGSKVMLTSNICVLVISISDVFLCGSTSAGQVAARFSLGVWSCLWSQHAFLNSPHLLQRSLHNLSELTGAVERAGTHPGALKRMGQTAKQSTFLIRFYIIYALSTQLVIFVTFIAIEPGWHKAVSGGFMQALDSVTGTSTSQGVGSALASSLRWSVFVVQMFALSSCLNSYYSMVSCIFVICRATGDIYNVLGRVLEVESCTKRWASLQSQIFRVALVTDKTVTEMLPHLLIVVVILPLLSTVEVVGNGMHADAFAVGTAPLIVVVFVPLCLVGDSLTVSRRGVARCAIRGPWLEEALDHRRLRLNVMLAAMGRGAKVRGLGIGVLDKHACGNAMRSWFSFLQILIQIQSRVQRHVGP